MGGSLAWRGTRTGNTQPRKRSIASMYPSGQLLGSFNEEIYVTQHDEVSLASPGPTNGAFERHVKLRGMTYISRVRISYGVPPSTALFEEGGRGDLNGSKMENV